MIHDEEQILQHEEGPTPETPDAPASKVYDVTLLRDDTSTHVVGRDKAIRAAKRLSREKPQPVEILRRDGRVRMRFFGGSLENYLYETRPNRRA